MIGVLALAAACGANVANAHIDADAPPHAAPAPKLEDRAMVDFKSCSKPAWSKPDLEAGHTGTVVLGFLISAEGEVLQSTVKKSSGYPGLDKAAESGISKCRFKPAKVNGKPVESWMQMMYVWQLHN